MIVQDIGKRRAEQCGLKQSTKGHYSANDVHELLGNGRELFGWHHCEGLYKISELKNEMQTPHFTYLAINKKAFPQDTIESMLRKLLRIGPASYASDEVIEIMDRAKKLLGTE